MTLRVPKAELPALVSDNMIKQFGAVPEPVEVTWHNSAVAQAVLQFGAQVGALHAADASLKTSRTWRSGAARLQLMPRYQLLAAHTQYLDMVNASQVPRWRESDVSTDWSGMCWSTPRL
jgi:hypothetical protein